MSRPQAPRGPGRVAAAWARLDARERRLVALAATVVGLALLWWVGLAPALRTLREAGPQRQALQAQAQQMQQLKTEAEALKALPRMSRDEALRALEASVKQRLRDTGQLSVVGDRANVVLKQTPADALAQWLADARMNARATPVDARLTRGAGTAPGAPVLWSGSLSLSLPQ
ncbi:MAG: type II secretion system protein GspM [Pseudomonadota bacterium]|nr:type II secretion system protein GspM [Pseudomonadota bacterium]